MQKQNSEMNSVSAIPIFGLTPAALDTEVIDKLGQKFSTRDWLYNQPNIISFKQTASSKDLGKYILVVERDSKEEVEEFVDSLFQQLPESDGTGTQFKRPQRGRNSFKRSNASNIKNFGTMGK
jgi:hypothetical protein